MEPAESQPPPVERPSGLQWLVWIVAFLAPLVSWFITFGPGYLGKTRDAGYWGIGGGLLCVAVAIVGLVRHHKPARWQDVALVVYGALMALRGLAQCGLSFSGEHACFSG